MRDIFVSLKRLLSVDTANTNEFHSGKAINAEHYCYGIYFE